MGTRPPSPLAPDALDLPAREFGVQIGPLLQLAYRVALRRSGDRDLAEDLVQEAALNAFVHYDQFKPGTNFRAWFMRILLNCLRSHYRRAWGRRRTLALHGPEPRHGSAAVGEGGLWSQTPDLADSVLSRLNAEQVADAIARLPDVYRTVCALYVVDDLSYPEIARILGCPVGTVRSRLHRSRRLLRDQLCCIGPDRSRAPQALVGRVAPHGRSCGQRSRLDAALILERP